MPIRVKDLQGTEYSIPLYVGVSTFNVEKSIIWYLIHMKSRTVKI